METECRTFMRTTHPYGFRRGEWAELLTVAEGPERDCYVVRFPDGETDWWVKGDPNGRYEYRKGGEFPPCGS